MLIETFHEQRTEQKDVNQFSQFFIQTTFIYCADNFEQSERLKLLENIQFGSWWVVFKEDKIVEPEYVETFVNSALTHRLLHYYKTFVSAPTQAKDAADAAGVNMYAAYRILKKKGAL